MQPANKLLNLRDVLTRLSMSRSVLYLLRSRGDFPHPIQISPGRVAWREKDIDAWIDSRPIAA